MSGAEIWQRLVSGAEALLAAAAREVVLAAVVFAVVWLACRALRGRRGVPPRLVHGLWALVLVRLVLPPGLGAPVGVGAVLGGWDAWREWMPAAEWSVGATADEAVVSVGQAGPEAQVHGLDPVTGAPLDGRPEAAAGNRRRGSVTAGAGGIWAPALVGLWLLGSGFVLALLGRRKRFYRRAVFAAGGAEPWVEEMAERWRGLLGVRRRVELRVGERRLPPFTAGVIRPVIFLPRTLVVRGGREAVEAAVAHEMAHVARLDALWLALQNAVQVVWFFNPLARAAAARLLDARERAADELVVARGAMPPRRYAAGLVAALSLGLATPGGPPPAPALGSSKRGVSVRIEEILRRRPGGSNPLLPALLCGLAAVLLLPLAAPASELPPAAPETPEAPALEAAPMAPEAPALAAPPSAPSAGELPTLPSAPSAGELPTLPSAPSVAELPTPPAAPAVAAVPAVAPVPSAPPAPAVSAAPRPAPAPVPAPAAVPAPAPPPAQAPEPAAAPAPVAAPVPAPAPVAPAALTSPLREARVTSGFGDRKDPKDGQVRLHRGLDLGAPVGTPVHAPATGVVRLADEHHGDDGRLGKTVVLDHGDGLETLYAHLESIAVREGQRVEAGEVIGRVGSSGVSTGAHLHLEVLQDGRPIDPMARIPGLSDR